MSPTVHIAERFVGPPGSGNGGYVCGLMAQLLTDDDGRGAQVTLRRPPPIDRPLRLEQRDHRVDLYDGEHLVADAEPADVLIPTPPAVTVAQAREAASTFDVAGYRSHHHYPRCFGCGPDRHAGDGLRIFPAPAGAASRPGFPGLVVWPWVPDGSLQAPDRDVASPFLWTALDCVGGHAWLRRDATHPVVLGRMTARIRRRPAPDEHLVVAGWPLEEEGRKRISGSAVWDADGKTLAVGRAVWVVLDAEKGAAFVAGRAAETPIEAAVETAEPSV